jgi:hypothetical protein
MIAIHLSHVSHTFFLLKVIDFTWLIKNVSIVTCL